RVMNYRALADEISVTTIRGIRKWAAITAMCAWSTSLHAQSRDTAQAGSSADLRQTLEERISILEAEVAELKAIVKQLQPPASSSTAWAGWDAGARTDYLERPPASKPQEILRSEDRRTLEFLRDTTLNLGLDGYYSYNFNQPVGRVNLLRPYDVLSNELSLNQASVISDPPPDLAVGRRWGGRLDLQFGQATDTLQGNPMNEPRPQIYRNIFQAYGTYLVP